MQYHAREGARRRARTFGRGSFRGVAPDPSDDCLVLLDGRLDDRVVLASLLRLQRLHALVKHVRVHSAVVAPDPAFARSVERHDAPGRAAPRGNARRAQGQGGGRAARRARAELAPEGRAGSRVRGHGARGSAQWSHGVWSLMHLARISCLLLMTWRGTGKSLETFARRHARLADRTDVLRRRRRRRERRAVSLTHAYAFASYTATVSEVSATKTCPPPGHASRVSACAIQFTFFP